jgi:hypothetical protein
MDYMNHCIATSLLLLTAAAAACLLPCHEGNGELPPEAGRVPVPGDMLRGALMRAARGAATTGYAVAS